MSSACCAGSTTSEGGRAGCAARSRRSPGRSRRPSGRSATRAPARRRRGTSSPTPSAGSRRPVAPGGPGRTPGWRRSARCGGPPWPPRTPPPRVAAMRERLEALVRDEAALQAEGEGLAVEARHVAAEVADDAARLRVRAIRPRGARSPRSRSGGHVRTPRSSSFAAASRTSASGSCSRRTRWQRPRSGEQVGGSSVALVRTAARGVARAGAASRRRADSGEIPGDRLKPVTTAPYGNVGSFGRRSSEPPLRHSGGRR